MALKAPQAANVDAERMRHCGRMAARILSAMVSSVRDGISTAALSRRFDRLAEQHGVSSAMRGFNGFPSPVSISVVPAVCNAVPTRRVTLREGDLVNIDVAVSFEGWITDTAATVLVGASPSAGDVRLLRCAAEAVRRGLEAVRPHGELRTIARAIEDHVHAEGFVVAAGLDGHGIGKTLHEAPRVSHVARFADDTRILPGMAFTIEPVVLSLPSSLAWGGDGWSLRAEPACRSACFEHTVLVGEHGVEILTVDDGEGR